MPDQFMGLQRRRSRTPVRSRRHSRGQSLVEASLIMPVLLLVVMIGVDFGRLYAAQVTVADAARQAARYGAANPADAAATSACAAAGWRGSVAIAQQEASGSPVSIACTDVALAAGGPDSYGGQYVKADVRAPFSFVTPFLTPLLHIDHVSGSDTAREADLTACVSSCCVSNCTPPPTPTPTAPPSPSASATPTPQPCTYSGRAWAAAITGVATAGNGNQGLVARADASVGDTGQLPSNGGTVSSGPLSFSIPPAPTGDYPAVVTGSLVKDTASGANCTGSAESDVSSATIGAGLGPAGSDAANVTVLDGKTAQACGGAAVQGSSVATIKIAGTQLSYSTSVRNQMVVVAGTATVYINSTSPGANPPSVDVVRIVFPPTGTLSARITGTVTIAHAQQGCV